MRITIDVEGDASPEVVLRTSAAPTTTPLATLSGVQGAQGGTDAGPAPSADGDPARTAAAFSTSTMAAMVDVASAQSAGPAPTFSTEG